MRTNGTSISYVFLPGAEKIFFRKNRRMHIVQQLRHQDFKFHHIPSYSIIYIPFIPDSLLIRVSISPRFSSQRKLGFPCSRHNSSAPALQQIDQEVAQDITMKSWPHAGLTGVSQGRKQQKSLAEKKNHPIYGEEPE